MTKPYETGLAGYVQDKVDNLLIALGRQVEVLQTADIEDSLRDKLLDQAFTAADMGMRLLASATDSGGYGHQPRLLIEQGLRGYRKVVDEWDLPSRVLSLDLRTEDEVLSDFLDDLAPLLDGPRSPNRTFIHELVCSTGRRHPTIRTVGDLVESVTMGEIDWPAFTSRAKTIIEGHGRALSNATLE